MVTKSDYGLGPLYHGTSKESADAILIGGLLVMAGQPVWLSCSQQEALENAYEKEGVPVVLEVNLPDDWLLDRAEAGTYHSWRDIPSEYIKMESSNPGNPTDPKLQVIETSFAGTTHYTATLSDDRGNILSLAEYEQGVDFILLRSISTPPQYERHGYASELFISGPLALSARTHKSIKTIGLTDSGKKLYEALESRGVIAIEKGTGYPGVYILTPVNESPPTPTGTCYHDAWQYVMRHTEAQPVLVHGTIHTLSGRINHAWVELPDGTVWDTASKVKMPIEKYYSLVDPIVEDRYTVDEAATMLNVGYHGPWTAEERMKHIGR